MARTRPKRTGSRTHEGFRTVTVLVLCDDLDITADRVIAELTSRQVPVVRANTAWFPSSLSIYASLGGNRWSGAMRVRERDLPWEEVRAVWYRRPNGFRFPTEMSEPERRHAGWEARFGLGGVLASLPVRWVNHPQREADACYKPIQLTVARECGLAVPHTVITNEPERVRQFAASAVSGIVVKTLSTPAVLESSRITVAHARRLSEADLADLSGVDVTAHLFQAWVEKAYEVRVTAVGRELFPVAIEATTPQAREDWHNDLDSCRYRVVDVPVRVCDAIAGYLDRLGLSYAAFDFVVDSDERWWFLEANPGGQYGWLQTATGLPISTAVADLLARG